MNGRRNGIDEMYAGTVRIFAGVIIFFGIVIVVATVVQGGGPTSVGLYMGLGFIALGAARLWLGRQ